MQVGVVGAVGIPMGKTMGKARGTEGEQAEEAKALTVEVGVVLTVEVGRVVAVGAAAVPAVKAQAVVGIPTIRTMRTEMTRIPNQTWDASRGGGRPG